jgi:hypothetical protein
LPAILYGIYSPTLREKQKLEIFENWVLRKLFVPKKGEVTREWRKVYKEELNDLYFSLNIIRVMISSRTRWTGHVVRIWNRRYAKRLGVGI